MNLTIYQYQRTCKCGHVDTIEVTKREAAFGLREKEIWNKTCSKCGNKNYVCISIPQPEFDKELLIEWGSNPKYFFMQQDEHILLGEAKNIDIILDILDNYQILNQKRITLIEALCVIIYDHSVSDGKNQNIINRVAHELKKRKADVLNAQHQIMDYIKDIVFPIIEIN